MWSKDNLTNRSFLKVLQSKFGWCLPLGFHPLGCNVRRLEASLGDRGVPFAMCLLTVATVLFFYFIGRCQPFKEDTGLHTFT